MTFAISQGCWFYARLGITFVTSQIKGWCFDISAWLTKWNPQSQFCSTMREKDDSSSLSLSKVSSVDDVKTEKRAKGLRLITRQANLLIVIAPTLDTWSWRAGQQNKISHKALLLLPNHKQVSPYPFFPWIIFVFDSIPFRSESTIGDWFFLDPWIIACRWIPPFSPTKTHCAPTEIGKCGIGYH